MATLPNGTTIENNVITGTEGAEEIAIDNYSGQGGSPNYLDLGNPQISVHGKGGDDELFGGDYTVTLFPSGSIYARYYGDEGDDYLEGIPSGTTEAFGGSGFDRFRIYNHVKPTQSLNYSVEGSTIIFEQPKTSGSENAKFIVHDDIEIIGSGGIYLITEELRNGVVRYIDSNQIELYRNSWFNGGNPTQPSTEEETSSGTSNEPESSAIETILVDYSSVLTGKSAKKDAVTGTDADDTIGNGKGADQLRGNGGGDTFTFSQKDKFGKKYADRIIDFDSGEGDKIALSAKALPGLRSAELGIATTKRELNSLYRDSANIIYYQPAGQLIYDQNGSGKGFGKGGIFAILAGSPELSAYDFGIF